MPDVPLHPDALARYDTVSHHQELFDGPAAAPYRFNWRAVHGEQLPADFKHALKRLEGLLYALWGGQPMYAAGRQWYAREHPRCRWGAEQWWQQPKDFEDDWFWNYLETAALGQLYVGAMPSVPVRSRSGDPAVQFKLAGHSDFFPLGSVQRYCGSPGATGHQVHDPAGTFKQFPAWPDAESVVIRYVSPPAVTSVEWLAVITSHNLHMMTQVQPGIWEATIPARTQDDFVWWFLLGNFNGQPGNHFDPFVGFNAQGNEIEPARRGRLDDPEHIGPSATQRHEGDGYYFTFFSHYNPYAHGLPELLDETPPHQPANWLRRGTDEYRFDSSEDIQPGLINLARFVLDHIGRRFQHSPRNRGPSENCCVDMPIEWRWSGSHAPDLYRTGGKGTDSAPLHNNPAEPNAGSQNARKSWRGIEMAWRSAGTVPGFFPDNWWYGDSESWLAWPEQLTLDLDPLNPPWKAIVRNYSQRGLAPGDAIDPVHIQEVIDAVDYLCTNGLWTTTPFSTAKLTIQQAWGKPCGVGEWGTHEDGPAGTCDENWDDTYGPFACNNKCCYECPGGTCVPYARPSWQGCWEGSGGTGWAPGKCFQYRNQYRFCQYWPHFGGDGACGRYDYDFFVDCNVSPFDIPGGAENGATLSRVCWYREAWDDQEQQCVWWWTECMDQTSTYGSAYYLCGPARCQGGPDATHGNGFTKPRWDHDHNFATTGPSMGNCFAELESCAELAPGEISPPDFETVTGVVFDGIGNPWWNDQFECQPGTMQVFDYAAPIPGLGIYNFAQTDTLSHFGNEDYSGIYADCREAPEGVMRYHWLMGIVGTTQWSVCRGEQVFVAIDLNLDAGGIPRLRDYNLGIADPFDDCPCETWTGLTACL